MKIFLANTFDYVRSENFGPYSIFLFTKYLGIKPAWAITKNTRSGTLELIGNFNYSHWDSIRQLKITKGRNSTGFSGNCDTNFLIPIQKSAECSVLQIMRFLGKERHKKSSELSTMDSWWTFNRPRPGYNWVTVGIWEGLKSTKLIYLSVKSFSEIVHNTPTKTRTCQLQCQEMVYYDCNLGSRRT